MLTTFVKIALCLLVLQPAARQCRSAEARAPPTHTLALASPHSSEESDSESWESREAGEPDSIPRRNIAELLLPLIERSLSAERRPAHSKNVIQVLPVDGSKERIGAWPRLNKKHVVEITPLRSKGGDGKPLAYILAPAKSDSRRPYSRKHHADHEHKDHRKHHSKKSSKSSKHYVTIEETSKERRAHAAPEHTHGEHAHSAEEDLENRAIESTSYEEQANTSHDGSESDESADHSSHRSDDNTSRDSDAPASNKEESDIEGGKVRNSDVEEKQASSEQSLTEASPYIEKSESKSSSERNDVLPPSESESVGSEREGDDSVRTFEDNSATSHDIDENQIAKEGYADASASPEVDESVNRSDNSALSNEPSESRQSEDNSEIKTVGNDDAESKISESNNLESESLSKEINNNVRQLAQGQNEYQLSTEGESLFRDGSNEEASQEKSGSQERQNVYDKTTSELEQDKEGLSNVEGHHHSHTRHEHHHNQHYEHRSEYKLRETSGTSNDEKSSLSSEPESTKDDRTSAESTDSKTSQNEDSDEGSGNTDEINKRQSTEKQAEESEDKDNIENRTDGNDSDHRQTEEKVDEDREHSGEGRRPLSSDATSRDHQESSSVEDTKSAKLSADIEPVIATEEQTAASKSEDTIDQSNLIQSTDSKASKLGQSIDNESILERVHHAHPNVLKLDKKEPESTIAHTVEEKISQKLESEKVVDRSSKDQNEKEDERKSIRSEEEKSVKVNRKDSNAQEKIESKNEQHDKAQEISLEDNSVNGRIIFLNTGDTQSDDVQRDYEHLRSILTELQQPPPEQPSGDIIISHQGALEQQPSATPNIIEWIRSSGEVGHARDCNSHDDAHLSEAKHEHKSYRLSFLFNK